MFLQLIAAVTFLIWYFVLRPRTGGKNAPPLVTSSGVPIVGVLMEFFKSPNTMVNRCVNDYGSVFTIPVRDSKKSQTHTPKQSSETSIGFDRTLFLSPTCPARI